MSSVSIDVNHLGSSGHVVRHTTVDWDTLKSHQTLSNLGVRGGIDLTTLGITEEVIQDVVATLSVVECGVLANISTMAVVDRAIGGGMLRSVVWGLVGVGVSIWTWRRTWVHGSAMIVVTLVRSCEVLQVSDYYFLVRSWYVESKPWVLYYIPFPGACL